MFKVIKYNIYFCIFCFIGNVKNFQKLRTSIYYNRYKFYEDYYKNNDFSAFMMMLENIDIDKIMYKEKTKLIRHEKRLLESLKPGKVYSFFKFGINYIFSFKNVFLTLAGTRFGKTIAMASVTFIPFLWRKIGYIDNVIVHKKQRGKGLGKTVMNKALEKLKSEKADYAILISKDKRKISHKMYKKMGFVVVSLGLGVFAYKRIKSKKGFFSKLYEKLFNF